MQPQNHNSDTHKILAYIHKVAVKPAFFCPTFVQTRTQNGPSDLKKNRRK